MAAEQDRCADLFQSFGPVSVRRMFGGAGLYSGDAMIGIVFDGTIFLKTNEKTRQGYLEERARPFTFEKRSIGDTIATSYYSLPDRLYDDPDELARWARQAYLIASQSETVKKKRAKGSRETTARQPPRRRRGR